MEGMIIPESDPLGWFTGGHSQGVSRMSDADATGFSWIVKAEDEGMGILIPQNLN